MYYPDDVIEEVRARNDIVDVISQYVTLKKKGANYFGFVPSIMRNPRRFRFSGETDVLLFWVRGRRERDHLYYGI